ncbi:hypothetical protein VP01_2811g2 [Puccinia sorghi]|uniref:Conserved oligomeric Golgi complex subunit 8 n=1 Tax=Puccinia sorghi TaxID=27349 RepID=A0A0L6V356_9BASI|nr:hypothetical protein VP01_2811g2 [Puccinia sorghi]
MENLSLFELIELPKQLKQEKQIITNEIKNHCIKDYNTFIKLTNNLNTHNNQLNQKLDHFIQTTEQLNNKVQHLETKNIIQQRNNYKLILQNQTTIQDLIELPQLIKTAINNQLELEAIQLIIITLSKLKTIKTKTTTHIQLQINKILQSTRDQLLNNLQKTNPIKSINIIRNLPTTTINNSELELAFLIQRKPIIHHSNSKTTTTIQKLIQQWRTEITETLSIYHHLFFKEEQHVLNNFITHTINQLINHLQQQLIITPIQSTTTLNSITTQLAYCANAFKKYACDFTISIYPIIIKQLEQLIQKKLKLATEQLINTIKPNHPQQHTTTTTRRRSLNTIPLEHSLIISAPNVIQRILKINCPKQSPAEDFHHAYITLFPPLVNYINAQLTALNELRLLPLAGAYNNITNYQFESLDTATQQFKTLVINHPLQQKQKQQQEEKEEEEVKEEEGRERLEETEDQEKRTAYRLALISHRLLLLWTRNVLPTLERALRVNIYRDLNFITPQPRFIDLINQAELLLGTFQQQQQQQLAENHSTSHTETPQIPQDHDKMQSFVSSPLLFFYH